jgi:murein DD-endopeptidase / murein LD-carboxypeptidase
MLKTLVPLTLCSTILLECSFPKRTGYDRNAGTWKSSPSRHLVQVASGDPALLALVKPWLGTPYRYGKQDKSGTDCSGFVQVIMQSYKQVLLPRNSAQAYKEGTSVDRDGLLPGDLVFFGSLWGIDHTGIWLGEGRFVHASTSSGVIITHLDSDVYWSKRYKGARRISTPQETKP